MYKAAYKLVKDAWSHRNVEGQPPLFRPTRTQGSEGMLDAYVTIGNADEFTIEQANFYAGLYHRPQEFKSFDQFGAFQHRVRVLVKNEAKPYHAHCSSSVLPL